MRWLEGEERRGEREREMEAKMTETRWRVRKRVEGTEEGTKERADERRRNKEGRARKKWKRSGAMINRSPELRACPVEEDPVGW